nr:MAG TPA: Bacterial TniB protein [Caudoviricetes sp.]
MDEIKKARQVGDQHPSKPWVWTEYKPGKFDWRPMKGKKATTASSDDDSGDDDNAGATKKTPSKPSAAQVAGAKAKAGKPMNSQQLLVWAQKTSDDNLLKVANSKNGNAQMRKIAYDALEQRGFDMSQVDTSGTLAQLMKMTGKGSPKAPTTGDDDDEVDVADTNEEAEVDIDDDSDGDSDGIKITEKWYLDKNDDRVKKMFNLKTKEGRIKYDQFVYRMKKKEKDYKDPVEVVQDLNEQYLEFLDNDEQRFMISAGGAGIGKSYGFNKMAELLNMKPFEEGDSPGDGDYDIFEAPDVNSGKQLLNILKAHNGKIIVFDDNDKVLKRADCASVMKKATATTGRRIVGDPDDIKQNFEFTGRIIIMTNKDLSQLSENEDTKAIISRAMMVSEIYMTVPETIQVMESRYQDYEFKQAPRLDDEGEDKKERDEILSLIKKNQKNIDPAQFTTRTFQEILVNKRKVDNANEKRSNPAFAALIGTKNKDWKEVALGVLTKAAVNDIEGSSEDTFEKGEDDELEKAEDIILGDEFEKGDSADDGVDYTVDDEEEEDMDEVTKAELLLLGDDYGVFEKAEFSEKQRKSLAKKKEAMPDGSFPIRNTSDLKNAIQAVGRAKDQAKAKAWIKKRAKALGKEDLLPDTWKANTNDFFGEDMDLQKAQSILGIGSGIMG